MSPHSESSTIRYYDEHAAEYIKSTVGLDLQSLYEPFLSLLPAGGKILDAGCGSGRDSKAFLDRGYEVMSIDASPKMVEATTRLTGQPAILTSFQEIELIDEFDGIWACASLLHVPLAELNGILRLFELALRPSGVCYASFKIGKGQRYQQGRLFNDMTESEVHRFVDCQHGLEVARIWRSEDLLPGRSTKWLNVLLRKLDYHAN